MQWLILIRKYRYEVAIAARKDIIMATGRSDYPNQVNNVLGFPYIFRGALDVRATQINEAMKLAAVKALAEMTKTAVPDIVNMAYNEKTYCFGPEYIIPKPLDPRLLVNSCPCCCKSCNGKWCGAKTHKRLGWLCRSNLNKRLGLDNQLLRVIRKQGKKRSKKSCFCRSR